MNVKILQLIDGAKAAKGLTVIIDVFRAMTVEAYVINNGAADLIPMASVEDALKYREDHPGTLLMGERGGAKCPGFDFGNSPSAVKDFDFTGRTVVHTTSAGTQGIANAKDADEIVCGSLVCAKAIARYIKEKNPEDVSLVCMGLAGEKETREDTLCAEYIKYLLDNDLCDDRESACAGFDMAKGVEECKADDGAKFFLGNDEVFPESDFWLSVEADRFDFAMKVVDGPDGLSHTVRI